MTPEREKKYIQKVQNLNFAVKWWDVPAVFLLIMLTAVLGLVFEHITFLSSVNFPIEAIPMFTYIAWRSGFFRN